EGLDVATVKLNMARSEAEGKLQPQSLFLQYGTQERGTGYGVVLLDESVTPLSPFYELLIAAGRRTAVLTEHPGWTFGISFEEEEPLGAGIRAQYGGWTRVEEEIALDGLPLWTGRELMILGWPNGAALDPLTGRWRAIRGNPRHLR